MCRVQSNEEKQTARQIHEFFLDIYYWGRRHIYYWGRIIFWGVDFRSYAEWLARRQYVINAIWR